MATKPEFVAAMGLLYSAGLVQQRGNDVPVDSTVREDLYWRLLQDIPGPLLLTAAEEHIAQSKFFPTVAEIRDAALAIGRPATPSAYEAWGAVQVELRNPWRYALDYQPDLDPLTLRAVECVGGLADLRHTSSRVADRARFIEAYQVLAARLEWEARLLPQVRDLRRRLLVEGAQRQAQALLEGGEQA